jgi:hypothetical protein
MLRLPPHCFTLQYSAPLDQVHGERWGGLAGVELVLRPLWGKARGAAELLLETRRCNFRVDFTSNAHPNSPSVPASTYPRPAGSLKQQNPLG